MRDRRPAPEADAGVPYRPDTENRAARSHEAKRKDRFVRSLVRSAFGRHYWDADLEQELRTQLANSKQRWK